LPSACSCLAICMTVSIDMGTLPSSLYIEALVA
jgi:hypothetical protein